VLYQCQKQKGKTLQLIGHQLVDPLLMVATRQPPEVFRLAKTAYRRANGGTVAPGIQAGVEARYIPDADMEPRELLEHKRKTKPEAACNIRQA